MRIAVIADIHGNLPAFEAVLEHITRQKVDLTLIAGDIVIGSPDSEACVALAMSLGCPVLRGNHERYVVDYGTPRASPQWVTDRFAPLQWAVAQVTGPQRRWMANLPATLRIPEASGLFFVHASERDDHDTIEQHTPEQTLRVLFPLAQERTIVRAHNHNAQVRIWERGTIVTCGSAGLPLDSNPNAQYLLLDQEGSGWQIRHQSVPYNLEATIQRFYDTNYLAATGPMGRLFFRELVTAAHHIVPFLRYYARLSEGSPVPLAQAVDRFLRLGIRE